MIVGVVLVVVVVAAAGGGGVVGVVGGGRGGVVGVGGGPLLQYLYNSCTVPRNFCISCCVGIHIGRNSTMACPTCSSRFRASLDFVQEFHSVVFKFEQTDPKNSCTNVHRDAQHVHRKTEINSTPNTKLLCIAFFVDILR